MKTTYLQLSEHRRKTRSHSDQRPIGITVNRGIQYPPPDSLLKGDFVKNPSQGFAPSELRRDGFKLVGAKPVSIVELDGISKN